MKNCLPYLLIATLISVPLCNAKSETISAGILQRVLSIRYKDSQGSSFTIEVDGRQYLITARHVVEGIADHDQIQLWDPSVRKWIALTVKVIKCKSEEADIIGLVLPQKVTKAFPMEFMGGIMVTQQVYFLGYPAVGSDGSGLRTRSFQGESFFEMPFVKSGIISAIDSTNKDAVKLYIDGHNNRGFSGGPIVFYHDKSKRFRVAGVVSSFPVGYFQVRNRIVYTNPGILQGFSIRHIIDAIRERPIGYEIEHKVSN